MDETRRGTSVQLDIWSAPNSWRGSRQITLTRELAQKLINARGASLEKSQPVAYLIVEVEEGKGNIADVYTSDDTHLTSIAYRPWDSTMKQDNYLFLT